MPIKKRVDLPTTPSQIEHYSPQSEEQKSYSSILQGKSTNALTKASKKSMELDPFTNRGELTTEGVQVFLENYNSVNLSVPAHKVLDAFTIALTSNFPYGEQATVEQIDQHRTVELTVNDYMELCNLKDRKEARKQLKEAVQTLYNISLEWEEVSYIIPEGKKKRVKQSMHYKARLLDFVGVERQDNPVKGGKALVKFTMDIAKYLSRAYVMAYPDKLLAVNGKNNPHSYYIGRKLAEHHNMNISKENANRISVSSLLKACPNLPSYNDVMKNLSRSVKQKIIDPFERDLMALENSYSILEGWRYCNSKGEPLTDEQVENYSYSEWESWLIEFTLKNYPDQSERIAKIEERKKRAKYNKAKGKKKTAEE